MTPFKGKDIFGRKIIAVRGRDGSAIIENMEVCHVDEDGQRWQSSMSMSPQTARDFAKWINEQGKPHGD